MGPGTAYPMPLSEKQKEDIRWVQTGVMGAGLELGGRGTGTAELTGGAADRVAPV